MAQKKDVGNQKIYAAGLKSGQRTEYPQGRGSFGPLGSLAKNGCGSLAAHNVLTLLGDRGSYRKVLNRFRRDWPVSTLLFGLLGANPIYVNRYITSRGAKATCYGRWTASACPGGHAAYLALYFWTAGSGKVGAHYQALAYDADKRLEAFNGPDRKYDGFEEFYEDSGARFMVVIGYDRAV